MYGIAGILSLKNSPQRQITHLVAMTRAMRHDSPNDEGCMAVGVDGRARHFFDEDSPSSIHGRFIDVGIPIRYAQSRLAPSQSDVHA